MAKRTERQIAIDDALTKYLCSTDEIYDYMARCARDLGKRLEGEPDVLFYVKGSVALARYLRASAIGATKQERIAQLCPRSDWDTQLVINPLLPAKAWFETFRRVEAALIDCLTRF